MNLCWCARVVALTLTLASLASTPGCSFAAFLGAPIACDNDEACPPGLACVDGACGAPTNVEPGIELFEPFIDVSTGLPNLRWSALAVDACVISGPGFDDEPRASEGVTLLPAQAPGVAAYALACDTTLTASTSVAWGVVDGALPAGFFDVTLLVDGFASFDGVNFANLLESGDTLSIAGDSTDFVRLPKLHTIYGNLSLSSNGEFEGATTTIAPALREVTGFVDVISSVVIPDFSLDALARVGSAVRIQGNVGLATLSLPSLREVGNDVCADGECGVFIAGNAELTTISLPALKSVDNVLIDAPALINLELALEEVGNVVLRAPSLACASLKAIACAAEPDAVDLQGSEGACGACD
jgi:hypothetical protein